MRDIATAPGVSIELVQHHFGALTTPVPAYLSRKVSSRAARNPRVVP